METTIKTINAYELGAFVKKLLPIDKFIFMKINPDETVSSVYFPERDAVKLVKVPTADIFSDGFKSSVKVSFYNGNKVVDALSHFGGNISGRIRYSEFDNELMASDFILENNDLTINLACTDPSLSFMEMTSDEITRAFGTSSSLFEFDLLTTHVDRMKSLFNLDKDDDVFTLYLNEKGIGVKGISYDASITNKYNEGSTIGSKVVVYKKYLGLLDKENYHVTVCSNKIVFRSLDTDTLLTVAVAITDED